MDARRSFGKLRACWRALIGGLTGAILLTAGCGAADFKPGIATLQPQPISIIAQPLPAFDRNDPARTTFGRLRWRGGLVLTSPSPNFGGWSGLMVGPGGRDLFAVSDSGVWLRARLVESDGAPQAMEHAVLAPLTGKDGKVPGRRRDRDLEAVALLKGGPGGGEIYIAGEKSGRIGRFTVTPAGPGKLQSAVSLPGAFRDLVRGRRDGIEAIAVPLNGPARGVLLAFTEHPIGPGARHAGWIWQNGSPKPLTVSHRDGYALTDAAPLPDGSVLLLERRLGFLGFSMRIRRIPAETIKPGAVLDGEVLIEAGRGYEVDNMEGLAVHKAADGQIVLTLLSDNNYLPFLQRTLLLQFTLLPEAPK